MKIYTRTGDDGTTGLFGGDRVSKDDLRIHAYGTVDELNSVIGLARTYQADPRTAEILDLIQRDLFVLGSDLAAPRDVKSPHSVRVDEGGVAKIERLIDELDAQLPALTNFILPGGTSCAAVLHLARNVCRRAERLAVACQAQEDIGPVVIRFLNRLSDLLFVLARRVNREAGVEDVVWKKT
jgi:cob(I)alamin adenosyltransferase